MRVDKFLWAVRVFKTRSMSSQHCREGKVSVDGQAVKPARDLKVGDVVEVRKLEMIRLAQQDRPKGLGRPTKRDRRDWEKAFRS